MRKHFVVDLCEHLDPCISERVGQVTLEIERNPKTFKEYAEYDAAYKKRYDAFCEKWSDALMETDDMIASLNMCYAAIMNEVYKQGARDCAQLLQRLGILHAHINIKEGDRS